MQMAAFVCIRTSSKCSAINSSSKDMRNLSPYIRNKLSCTKAASLKALKFHWKQLYNQCQNILALLAILSFFENQSSDENPQFSLAIGFNRLFQFGSNLLTSRLYFQPFWTTSELLDPQIVSSLRPHSTQPF